MKTLKMIHCADIHLDAPFRDNGRKEYAETRRNDIRNAFLSIIRKVREEEARLLLISGDLFEHGTVSRKTIEWLCGILSDTDARVIIIPGNHDPYVRNSYYRTWDWPSNVHILSNDNPHLVLETEKANIFGIGFSSFREDKPELGVVPEPMEGYFNILMIHGTLDFDLSTQAYHPVTSKELESLGYDYYALGHLHKNRCDYPLKSAFNPGSPEPLGFDEAGVHGAFFITLTKSQGEKKISAEHFKTATRQYHEKTLDVSGLKSIDELKMKLLALVGDLDPKHDITSITLKGRSNLVSCAEELASFLQDDWFYLKINDETTADFDLEQLKNDPSIKGAFAAEMSERLQKLEEEIASDPLNLELKAEREKLELAVRFGLEALTNGKIEWFDR